MEQPLVNGLPLPSLLVEMLRQGTWRHPGDEVLQRLIPFFREPVDFLTTVEAVRRDYMHSLADDPKFAKVYRVARRSRVAEPICLPWLDVEKAVFVAVNHFPGDDLAIALDYRTGAADPRVVASDWDPGPGGCLWREVAPSFSEFVRLMSAAI